jgi:hypothetical protein
LGQLRRNVFLCLKKDATPAWALFTFFFFRPDFQGFWPASAERDFCASGTNNPSLGFIHIFWGRVNIGSTLLSTTG